MHHAMKILDATAAVDKEWEKFVDGIPSPISGIWLLKQNILLKTFFHREIDRAKRSIFGHREIDREMKPKARTSNPTPKR